ncbi:HAD-IIB family hydrolase [Clostridium perfringens]|uniref:HAD-IIB family hydrolase n=1 Tax=Clostridium perfringens TaxID=1502 RepID=UPI0018980E45|nr:HAD-IIB family hydrolase [Clostridium perfringens]MDM0885546.1 HAD-IIB family hydrolase [Clostridium perfringens]HAT4301697.1 HAD-IIB family hydrolase [Clostridium perfringens]
MIVASDLDGTLLDDSKKVGLKEKVWIERYLEDGNIFVVLTSRNYRDTKKCIPWLFELKNNQKVYIGYDEGAHVIGTADFSYSSPQLDLHSIKEILEKCRCVSKSVTIFTNKAIYDVFFSKISLFLAKLKKILKGQSIDKTLHIDKITISRAWKIKLNLLPNLVVDDLYEELIANLEDFSVTNNEDEIEIMHKMSGKKGALQYICGVESQNISNVIYLGDEGNDKFCMEITESYAMGNAPDRIKKIAKHVTKDNNNGGAYEVFLKIEDSMNIYSNDYV